MTLIWTTLPAGLVMRDGDWRARVSIFLSPRLDASADGATLADFPEFLDWPRTLRELALGGIAFDVELGSSTGVIGTARVSPPAQAGRADAADSAAWRGVFAAGTPVRAVEPPPQRMQTPPMMSYPTGRLVEQIRSLYTESLAACIDDCEPPDLLEIASDAVKLGGPAVNQSPLEAFARFHTGSRAASGKRMAAGSPECPDFHEVVGGLGSYPLLLRKLGLVFDVELLLDEIGLGAAQAGLRLRTGPANAPFDDTAHHRPWTALDFAPAAGGNPGVFRAAAPASRFSMAAMALDGDRTTVVQENFEHVAFALLHAAQQADNAQGKSAAGDAGAFELPPLVQGGMRVAHADVPSMMQTAIAEQAALERTLIPLRQAGGTGLRATFDDAGEELVDADHVLRGYRVDVRDMANNEWRSLCRRRVRYEAGDWSWTAGDTGIEDEGTIEPIVYEDENAGSGERRATEDLFEWDGWSLVVPRDDEARRTAAAQQAGCAASAGTALNVTMTVPAGSLQPQRFGHCYQFRLRSVDLAGNGPGVDDANALPDALPDGVTVTQPMCCLRVESVKPPVVFRAMPRGPNESGDVIVLRDADARDYRTSEFRLHVLPPEVPLSLAEKHGVFDAFRIDEAWELISSHRGQLEVDADGNPREAIADRTLYSPYLPDPLVRQAVMSLPDGGGTIDLPRFDDIPRRERGRRLARACSLVVKPGADRAEASVSGREVTLRIPRGRVQKVQLAAKLTADELRVLAQVHPEWHNDNKVMSGDLPKKLLDKAAQGDVPLLAPATTLTFVFATQRPLESPAFGRPLVLPRDRASTVAKLADDALRFDRPSTGRIDVYARWEDPVDDPDEDGWTLASNEIHAGGVRIDEDGGKPLDPAELAESERSPLAHDFGDTRFHEVEYRAVAASRFATYFPASLTSDAANITLSSTPVTLKIPATAPPDTPDVAYVIPTVARRGPATRDARKERTSVIGGEGLRVYMNRGWFSSGKGEQLALVLAHGRSTGDRKAPVCEWGENPLRDGAPLPGPLELRHVWGGAERIEHRVHDGEAFSLALFDVQFSNEHQLPFADIEFLSQQAYMPLVRLALARFQRNAIDGCQLSPIAQADFVPLMPGRSLTVRKTAQDTWHLAVQGYSFAMRSTFSHSPTSIIRASIEVIPREAPADSLSWRRVGKPLFLQASSEEPWRFQWSGNLRLEESDYLSLLWRRRLVVEEFEPFPRAHQGSMDLAERSRLVSLNTLAL